MNQINANQLKIAWFTPNSTYRETLSTAFSKQVLPFLAKEFKIKVYTDSFKSYENYQSAHYLTAAQDHSLDPYDLFVYQVENHPSCHFARAHLGLIPGMVIFHHLNFVDYGAESFLNSPWTKIIPQVSNQEIQWPSRKNKYLPTGPFGLREASFALQPLFTNPQNLSEFKRTVNEEVISRQYQVEPVHLSFPVGISEPISVSQNLKIATVAKPSIAERVPQFLTALKTAPSWKLTWLIEAEESDLVNNLLEEFRVKDQITLVHGRNSENWVKVLEDSTVALHLLFSVFEQPAPYFNISMALGKTVIASDYGLLDYLPTNLVYKVPPGIGESETISKLLNEFENHPELLNGEVLREYALENFSSNFVADEFSKVIKANLSQYQKFYFDWKRLGDNAKQNLLAEVANLMNQNMTDWQEEFLWEHTLKSEFNALDW